MRNGPRPLVPRLTEADLAAHRDFVTELGENALWREYQPSETTVLPAGRRQPAAADTEWPTVGLRPGQPGPKSARVSHRDADSPASMREGNAHRSDVAALSDGPLGTDRGGLGTSPSKQGSPLPVAQVSPLSTDYERVLGKKLKWLVSKRRKITRALSIKTESERTKTEAAARWLKIAERQAAHRKN